MITRRTFLASSALAATGIHVHAAESRIRDIKTIASLPRSSIEMKEVHDRSSGYAAELLPEDEAFETKGFAPYLTKSDEIAARVKLPNTSIRRHALSVGLEVLTEDQKHLPLLSREQILSYLKSNFVTIQARIYRDPISRELYLGHRCLAATKSFRDGNMTKPFNPTVAQSIANTRSAGLLLPKGTPPTPSNLRTLVLIHKNQISEERTKTALPKTTYEYVFIRALDAGPDRLDLHAFATTDERTKFHWLFRGDAPTTPRTCSIRAAVHFTEYSHQGLVPKSTVVRRSMILGQKDYAWADLESFSESEFGLSPYEKMPEIIDAIISGKFVNQN